MVTDSIVLWFFGLLDWILDLIPTVPIPGWLSDAEGPLSTVLTYAGSMGVWFPTDLLVTVLLAVLSAWGIGFAVKVVRIVASFFTAGGGSAA